MVFELRRYKRRPLPDMPARDVTTRERRIRNRIRALSGFPGGHADADGDLTDVLGNHAPPKQGLD